MRLTLSFSLPALLFLVAPAGAVQDPPRQNPPVQVPPVQAPPVQEPAKPATPPQDPPQVPFDEWLAAVRVEAKTKGISDATLDAAFTDLVPDPSVIARDRAQPELTRSLDEYISSMVTARRMSGAVQAAGRAKATLAKVEDAYGVSAPIMVAVWGLESNFGEVTGRYSTITSLATLAYDGRRSLFRTELFEALRILEKGLVVPEKFLGSWAGAIGQPQFMPSSFLRHAVDFDGDGRIDLWTSEADVLGSMAEYLNAAGWTKGARWGREVRISEAVMDAIDPLVPRRTTGCRAVREMTRPQPLAAWGKLGVTLIDGRALPAGDVDASLVRGVKRNFLVYRNYEALLSYNCSNAYAVSAGLIADAVAAKQP